MYHPSTENGPDLHTLSMALRFRSQRAPQIFAAFAATLSAFGMGTVEAYTSPALPDMQNGAKLGAITEAEYSHIASDALLAAILSGIPTCLLLEKIGRKATIMLISIPFVTGWLMIAFAVNLTMVEIGRILTGFCAGSASMAVPVFLGEVAEDSIRGFLGSSFQFQVTSGNLFVYILGKYLNWQWLAFTCSLVIFTGLVLMSIVPPSPRFLLSKGRVQDAARALVWMRGADCLSQVENELNSIKKSVESSQNNQEKFHFHDYFRLPILRPMFISLLLLFFQQMTGVEAILVYTVDIFDKSGSALDPHTSVIVVGSLQVIATFISALIVDKAGRRLLLLVSSLGSALAMGGLGAWFYYCVNDDSGIRHEYEFLNWIPLVTMGFFIVFFALGLGPVPFIMIAELNNAKMIGVASALATTFNWTFAFLVTKYFLLLTQNWGFHFLFWCFAALSVIGAIFIFIFVPETKGKSMDDIQRYFKAI
ncbi:Facilitated trehalose transporter Tret1 [Orchesella cincta]|uniref:Facilitated trehalose transporter Tret1 n=1 Tax=Orchesella cincta TaxID=48709 RepID=A0A1D2NEJ0_ORCCI|nr:Facilitated trehalose transporter Tret1 [Orchesella cincta]